MVRAVRGAQLHRRSRADHERSMEGRDRRRRGCRAFRCEELRPCRRERLEGLTPVTDFETAPSVDCPFCHAFLSVKDEMCWRCEKVFLDPRELWHRYELERARGC